MQIQHKDQVPEWLTFPFIEKGYRYQNDASYQTLYKSLFTLHNESVNIWTMIIANIISINLLAYSISTTHHSHWHAFIALYLCSFIHLPFTVGYHLFLPKSPETYNIWRKLDLSFIFISSIFLTYALSVHALSFIATYFLCLSSIFCTLFAIRHISKLKPKQKLDKITHTCFISTIVLIYLTPMVITCFKSNSHIFTVCTITTIISLLGGAFAYAFNIPERFCPGCFDFFGSSHNIMHIGLIIAHIFEFIFIYSLVA